MARPFKDGLDYFPLAVDIDQKDEFQILQAECGMEGFAIFIKLSMKIYKHSYYTPWNNREALIFAKKNSVDINVVNNVIEVCLNENIFDKELFKRQNILSSADVQENYFNACIRRKRTPYVAEYLLIDIEQYSNLVEIDAPPVESDDLNEVNVDKNTTDDTKSQINVNINPKSDNSEKVEAPDRDTRIRNKTKNISPAFVDRCKGYFLAYFRKEHRWGEDEERQLKELILYISNYEFLDLRNEADVFESFVCFFENMPDLWRGAKPRINILALNFEYVVYEMRQRE